MFFDKGFSITSNEIPNLSKDENTHYVAENIMINLSKNKIITKMNLLIEIMKVLWSEYTYTIIASSLTIIFKCI